MINALQGTRMGRKVKSVKEVLEEVRAGNNSHGLDGIVPIDPQSNSPVPNPDIPITEHGYPDHFKFQDLNTVNGVSRLTNLELPSGTWSELKLNSDIERFTQSEFFGLSDGTLLSLDGELMIDASGFTRPKHICPLRVQYWFFRAAYQKWVESRGTFVDPLIETFREYSKVGYHFAEQIQWHDDGLRIKRAKVDIGGWPKSHPLNQEQVSCEIPSIITEASLLAGAPYLPMLTKMLFDDPSPSRVQSVLAFATGHQLLQMVLRFDTRRSGPYALSFVVNEPILDLTGNPEKSRYAQWLYAPEENFTPRKVGP